MKAGEAFRGLRSTISLLITAEETSQGHKKAAVLMASCSQSQVKYLKTSRYTGLCIG